MVSEKKEGQSALFFLIVGFLLSLKVASSDALIVWWLALTFLIVGALLLPRISVGSRLTPIAIVSILFTLLLGVQYMTASMDSVAIYLCAFMITGLVLGLYVSRYVGSLLHYLALIFSLLGLWALVQYFGNTAYIINMGSRANAIFTTPNSFAAGLNLVGLLLTGLYLGRQIPGWTLAIILVLFSALLVTESRGGWIAYGGGLILLLSVLHYVAHAISGQRLKRLGLGLGILVVLYITQYALKFGAVQNGQFDTTRLQAAAEQFPLATMASSGNHRLQIYADAWQLIREKPILGHGFMTFGDHYSRVQSQRHDRTTDFVHNDYLQFWVEMGLPGLCLLLLLILACLWQTWRALPQLPTRQQVISLSLLAALAAYFAHALVDFVLYIPALFLLAMAYVGYLNHLTAAAINAPEWRPQARLSLSMQKTLSIIGALAVIYIMLEPALGQVAAHAAAERQRSEPAKAAQLYRLARKLASYEAGYYHQEAEWRMGTALRHRSVEELQRAADLYKASIKHNPFDITGRYRLAQMNVLYRTRLDEPLSAKRIRSLLKEIRRQRPWDRDLALRLNRLEQALQTQS